MKKFIMLIPAMALMVADVFAMDKSSIGDQNSVSNITKKQKLKRVDSRARLPILKNKDLLPEPMSTEEYIDMLKKFLNENNQLIDPKEFIQTLDSMEEWLKKKSNVLFDFQRDFSFNPEDYPEYKSFINKYEALFHQTEEKTNPHLPKDTIVVDFSCPNIMIWAFKTIVKDKISEENPSNISSDQHLNWNHIAWIVKYFAKHVNKIQAHEIDPDDKYDSGLTDDEIDLLIKLSVGPNRVFDISEMSESEQDEFTNIILKDMLRNATGFQRILSLLIVSTTWHEYKQSTWQAKISFGSDGNSHHKMGKIYFNKSKFDYSTPFHEISHFFHGMIIPNTTLMDLITNISIINYRDINLIDQYFPMLRPSVMNPILKQIEEFINKYFGYDFTKITEEEKQRLMVILEPIIRNIMMGGFGSFIFPSYKQSQSLKISIDMLTTKRMSMCLYLQGLFGRSLLNSFSMKGMSVIIVKANAIPLHLKLPHPVFNKVKIIARELPQEAFFFGDEGRWTTSEEKLTMQGNSSVSINGTNFYIQDRQNEHIYRIRSQSDRNTSHSIENQFRYHETDLVGTSVVKSLTQIIDCCSSLDLTHEEPFTDLATKIEEAFKPSTEIKYVKPFLNSDKKKLQRSARKTTTLVD